MTRRENPATQKTDSTDGKPSTARKQSRMEEIITVIEEYASGYREFLKWLRKKHFH
jgi:hypothetical protein